MSELLSQTELAPQRRTPRPAATPESLLNAFFAGRNPRTLKSYRQGLEDFRSFLQLQTVEEAAQELLSCDAASANALVLEYQAHLKERELAVATRNHRLSALRSLVKLGRMLGVITWSLEVSPAKAQKYRDTRGPGKEGVQEMLKELEHRGDKKGLRDTAMVRLLFDLALRAFEVVGLDVKNVDLKSGALWVLGKGDQERARITLAPKTSEAIFAWLKVRGSHEGPLFGCLSPDAYGQRLTTTGLYLTIRKLGEKVGIRARPHGLRHAAVTAALDAMKGDIRSVQKFSRHKDVRVLCVYDDQRKDVAGEVSRMISS
jgi:integrase/recombinase XerC